MATSPDLIGLLSPVCCRVGQELGPSAALAPISEALSSLHSRLHSTSAPLGAVTLDLLHQLAQATLLQELCSGDLQAVPGLMTSSRLTCLLQLLQDEAQVLPEQIPTSKPADSAFSEDDPSLQLTHNEAEELPAQTPPASKRADSARSGNRDQSAAASAGDDASKGADSALAGDNDESAAAMSNGTMSITESEDSSALEQRSKQERQAKRALIFVAEDITAHRYSFWPKSQACMHMIYYSPSTQHFVPTAISA